MSYRPPEDGYLLPPQDRRRHGLDSTAYGVVSLLSTFALIGLAIAILIFTLRINTSIGASVTLVAPEASADCDDGNVCTIDLLDSNGLGYCESFPLSKSADCTSECYAADAELHCDGRGTCVSDDAQTCKGFCNITLPDEDIYWRNCNTTALFPLHNYYVNGYYPKDVPIQANEGEADCFANRCTFSLLQMVFETSPMFLDSYIAWSGAAGGDCIDLIDNAQVDTSCIVAQAIYVDSDDITDFLQEAMGEAPTSNLTARFCVYHYACAELNTTMLDDPYFDATSSLTVQRQRYESAAAASAQPVKKRADDDGTVRSDKTAFFDQMKRRAIVKAFAREPKRRLGRK